jgi:hypothetical protein
MRESLIGPTCLSKFQSVRTPVQTSGPQKGALIIESNMRQIIALDLNLVTSHILSSSVASIRHSSSNNMKI